jgi:hypothetical protein
MGKVMKMAGRAVADIGKEVLPEVQKAVEAVDVAVPNSGVMGRRGPAGPCKPSMDLSITALVQRNAELQQQFKSPFLGPRHFIQTWAAIGADSVLLKVIAQGVRVAIHQMPKGSMVPMAKSDLDDTLKEYHQLGVIRPLSDSERIQTRVWTHIFSRPKAGSTSLRMITNLKPLNYCISQPHFKADTWNTVLETVHAWPHHVWALTLDLRHWFFHLALHKQSQRWVRLQSSDSAYQFVGMPFGLACSPYWAARMSKTIVSRLRSMGLILVWYVDDVLILNQSPSLVERDLGTVISLLNDLGVQLSLSKCNLVPSTVVTYLGQRIDFLNKTVTPLPLKLVGCSRLCRHLSLGKTVQPCRVAQLAGSLMDLAKGAMNLVGIPKILMHLAGTMAQHGWYQFQHKSKLLQGVLHQVRMELQQVQPWIFHTLMQKVTVLLTSDACHYGWGGTLQVTSPAHWSVQHQVHQMFTPEEMERHITWKETMASTRCLQALWKHVPRGAHILVKTDASCCVATWNKGSNKPHLNECVRKMRCQLAHLQCTVGAEHLAGVSNGVADRLSRLVSGPNTRTIRMEVLRAGWGSLQVQPEVDMFAEDGNHRLPLFWSWGASAFALAQDAFSQNWSQHILYGNPPCALIPRMLSKIASDRALVVTCLPLWVGASWWPSVLRMQASPMITLPRDIHLDPWGYPLPPLPWRTCMVTLKGSRFNWTGWRP